MSSKIVLFKAGEEVPQWVERTMNARLVWLVDAKVRIDRYTVHVYPAAPLEGSSNGILSIMQLHKIDDEKPAEAIGAPTWIHAHPMPSLWQRLTSWARREEPPGTLKLHSRGKGRR